MNRDQAIKSWPDRIYLQCENEHGDGVEPYPTAGEITWCADSISKHDVSYVRSDIKETARIEPEVASASIDGVEFALLLDQYADSKAPACYPLRDALISLIDSHCAQQVAEVEKEHERLLLINAALGKERDELDKQLTNVTQKFHQYVTEDKQEFADLRAQLAARIEPTMQSPAMFGIKRLHDQTMMAGFPTKIQAINEIGSASNHFSVVPLYAAPQPIAQPAPSILESAFEDASRMGVSITRISYDDFFKSPDVVASQPAPDWRALYEDALAKLLICKDDLTQERIGKAAPSIPDGWTLVPIEPTREMMDGSFDNISLSDAHSEYGVNEHVWAYMLAAAPKQNDGGE